MKRSQPWNASEHTGIRAASSASDSTRVRTDKRGRLMPLVPRSNGYWFGGYPFTVNVLDNIELNPGDSTGEVIARVTENLLDAIQQHITMDLKMPWPPVIGKPLGTFAMEMAKVEGDTLHLWFEVDGHALLSAQVDLSDTK
jgi:hypothetical protein